MANYLGGLKAVASTLLAIILGCMYGIHTLDMKYGQVGLDDVLTSHMMGTNTLALVRILCGSIVWVTCIHMLIDTRGPTLQVITPYGKPKALKLEGIARFTAFTQWSWAMQGWYFFFTTMLWVLNRYYPHVLTDSSYGLAPHVNTICFALWIMYELSVTMSFLVTTVVTFILIPKNRDKKLPIDNYYRPLTLMMHNFNVFFMTLELGLNSFKFCHTHILVVAIWGISYVVFAWFWYKYKGVFFYFFLDYHSDVAVLYHLGLLSLMSFFYAMCAFVANYIHAKSTGDTDNDIPFYILLAFSCFIMKWPKGAEWDAVWDAIKDNYEGRAYVQAPPTKAGLALALEGATMWEKEPSGDSGSSKKKKPAAASKNKRGSSSGEEEEEEKEDAKVPAPRRRAASRSRSSTPKKSGGGSGSRSRSKSASRKR